MINLILLAIILGSGSSTAAADGGISVTVTVTGTQPSGRVLAEVFADAESFKTGKDSALRFAIDPKGTAGAQTTISLPPGRYMIAMFQDTKGTGNIEKNFLGKPTVPYGFSNNATGRMGPPEFDAAAFDVGSKPVSLAIQLR